MDWFSFWQRWLFVVSLIIVLFGLVMALLNGTPVFDLFNGQIDPVFWNKEPLGEAAENFQAWIYGVLGATVAGWGIIIAFVVHYPFKRKEKWAWNSLAAAVLFWYVLDTAISLYYGVGFNAVFNTILLILILLPLVFTRKQFL
jgi:hypothetical protein